MTLKAKSGYFVLIALCLIFLSFKLLSDYKKLNDSLLKIIQTNDTIKDASYSLYKALNKTGNDRNGEDAKNIIEMVPVLLKPLETNEQTADEMHHIVDIKIAFIRIERLLKGISGGKAATAKLKQIQNELIKIDISTNKFGEINYKKIERLKSFIVKGTIVIYFSALIGVIMVFTGFYRSAIRPIISLSSQVEAVKGGKIRNISVSKKDDEIGRLSSFTSQTLGELYSSYEVTSNRYEMQYAISEILKASQKEEGIDQFLGRILEIILSMTWLDAIAKGGIFIVDDLNPCNLILRAEKNFSEFIKETCSQVPFGTCICGRTAESGEITYKADIDEEHEIRFDGIIPHGHYCVPIKHKGNVLGVINLYLESSYISRKEDIEFLNTISIIIADALAIKKLAEREQLITKAIEQAGDSVIITDTAGTIVYVNPAFEHITGYSSDEVLGQNPRMLKSGKHDKEFYRQMWSTLTQGNVWTGSFINRRKDNTLYEEEAVISPVRDANGKIVNYVAAKRDVTHEKKLEAQILHSQKMEAIGTLAGGIAHDFNNILTSVVGYIDIIKNKINEDNELWKPADIIEKSAEKGAFLAGRIMAVTRKEALELKSVDINTIVKDTFDILSRSIPKEISIKLDLKDELPKINAEQTQIQQVIMNLAINARDAMPDGGILTMETTDVEKEDASADGIFSHSGFIRLSVSDTGKGIEKDDQIKIFDPFFTSKDLGKGTGLGLYIVHSIVTNHKGYINLYSEPNEGTRFNIYFPVYKGPAEETSETDTEDLTGSGLILVIDDDDHIRELSKDLFKTLGYDVITAPSGFEGISIFRERKDEIAVVILDMIMPQMGGPEVFKGLQAIKPDVKVVLCSGYNYNGLTGTKELLENGAKGFIQKPFTRKTIAKTLQEAISLS